MSLPVIYAIVGGLATGATYTADDHTVSKKDWVKYTLSILVIIISLSLIYLAHIHVLTIRTCIVAEVVLTGLFLALALELKNAQEGSPKFIRAVYILSSIMCGIAGLTSIGLYYSQHKLHLHPMDNIQLLIDRSHGL